MCADHAIPDRVRLAFELLTETRPDIVISLPLQRSQEVGVSATEFECALDVPENGQGIPRNVVVRFALDDAFPYTPVKAFPICDEVRGFPHQDAWSGKLCLKEERRAPLTEARLVTYVEWAEEWLADAATGQLLHDGHPYELPDFSIKSGDSGASNPYSGLFLFHESEQFYEDWNSRIGSTGTVELAVRCLPTAVVATEFRAGNGDLVRHARFSDTYLEKCERITGRWALIDDIRYFRHRPPQTFAELAEMFEKYGWDADAFFRGAWKDGGSDNGIAVVLIGWPVPKMVGDPPVRVHWRALVFRSHKYYCKKMNESLSRKKSNAFNAWPDMKKRALNPLPWIDGENLATEDLHSRWQLSASLRRMCVGVIGCGAVGSLVAEILVRGGVERMHLFDGDVLRYGNLSRHTLGGWDVDRGKAVSLAVRAQNINPLAKISGHGVMIPVTGKGDMQHKAETSLDECDLYIDCSTSNGAGAWLSDKARRSRKRMAMMFIDYRAEHLTLCVSGRNTKCMKVEQNLYEDVRAEVTPLRKEHYFAVPSDAELCIPSPGCWHPTFPAALVDIQALVACAVRELSGYIEQPELCSGLGVILKRNVSGVVAESRELIEIAWRKDYR